MKVMIVKELMTGDVSPVAMFYDIVLCTDIVCDFIVHRHLFQSVSESVTRWSGLLKSYLCYYDFPFLFGTQMEA